ncbi:hypothetical protein [Streptomyces sp. NRRL S-646]|uniref:hypothetical protein n=1 Tax=Streptomyces sp. NRRL S-646 TaxID=1463917 RepID=UPI00055D9B4D|nr:hypothetical protein [Streptomyces sp. NRRL S-646]
MGERQSDGSAPGGRRRVHPGGTVSGTEDWPAGPVLESLLADAMCSGALDAEAEQRAVAAFRAARDAGTLRARTRRRDDWRPREHGRARRSLRATLTLALAGLTMGGVAFAAIGSVDGSSHDDGRAARQRQHTPVGSSATASRTPGAAATPDRPDTAKDTEAHCLAYEKKVDGNGKALDATAWRRLVAAAGGEANVTAYCAEQLGQSTATAKPGKDDKTAKVENTPKAGNTGKADDSGKSGKSGKPEKSAEKAGGKTGN